MNYHALLRLKQNPHYKLSEKQKKQLAEYETQPVVLFGIVEKNDNTFAQHNTKVVKKSYGK